MSLNHDQLDQFVNENIYKDFDTSRWTCSLCSSTFLNKIDVARHIEAKHVILPELPCTICKKAYKTRHSLKIHMKNAHQQSNANTRFQ